MEFMSRHRSFVWRKSSFSQNALEYINLVSHCYSFYWGSQIRFEDDSLEAWLFRIHSSIHNSSLEIWYIIVGTQR